MQRGESVHARLIQQQRGHRIFQTVLNERSSLLFPVRMVDALINGVLESGILEIDYQSGAPVKRERRVRARHFNLTLLHNCDDYLWVRPSIGSSTFGAPKFVDLEF